MGFLDRLKYTTTINIGTSEGVCCFFKMTLISLDEVENVFQVITFDILDRFEHV